MATLDKAKLLAHLKSKADRYPDLVASAVLDGLVTAIERGDFDTERDE